MKFGKKLFLGLMVAMLAASMLVSAALAAPLAAGCGQEEEQHEGRLGGSALGFSLQFVLNALFAGDCTIPEQCVYDGGTWTGLESPMSPGSCVFAADTQGALAHCEAGHRYTQSYFYHPAMGWTANGSSCVAEQQGGGDEEEQGGGEEQPSETPSTGTGSTPTERTGRDDDETDPALKTSTGDAGPQSFTTFDDDACPGWCTVNSSLPEKAANSLPAGTNKTLYVRLVDENQDPYQGHYVACFNRSEVPNPVVYRYVEGVWVAIPAYSTSSTQICISAYGDGSFALVNE